MQTYTHAIVTAFLDQRFKDKRPAQIDHHALVIGSAMPDIPLYLLTIAYMVDHFYVASEDASDSSSDHGIPSYFNDPVWIIAHSVFHAPIMIILMLLIGYIWGIEREKKWGRALFSFAMGCGLHCIADIATHHNDGPLLLFPLNWKTRFPSPVSYWQTDHFGCLFAPLEHIIDIVLLMYLAQSWWQDHNPFKTKKSSRR